MTYGAIREFTPYVGKDAVLETRLKRAVSAMTKHGANSSIFKVIMGDRAGDYEIYNFYESVAAGAKAMQGFMSDPEMIAVNAERSANPIAEMRGPWVGRMLHNHMRGNVTTVTGVREYQVARSDVPKMMELVPKLQKITDAQDADLGVGVPLFSNDHSMMRVVYRFKDLDHWASSVDAIANNQEFAALVEKANEIGTLMRSRVLMKL